MSFTDNTVALSAMRRLSTRADAPAMAAVIRRRTHWLLEHAVVEAAERITSANNVWADWGSRGRVGDVCAVYTRTHLLWSQTGVNIFNDPKLHFRPCSTASQKTTNVYCSHAFESYCYFLLRCIFPKSLTK